MLDLLRPKYENGIPRRFQGHREAFLWVAVSLARYGPQVIRAYVYSAGTWLVWSGATAIYSGKPLDLLPYDWPFFVAVAVVLPLAAWVLGSVLIYAYLALAGGVMSRNEREQPTSYHTWRQR